MNKPPHTMLNRMLPLVLVVAVVLSAARVAWVCDDAYITFRTIDHWQLGYGPVWNVDERVQTYTHPLWMLILAGISLATGELYFTAIGLGLVLSGIALVSVQQLSPSRTAAVALLALGSSKAWTEFATSGLENSLGYAVVSGALWCLSQRPMSPRTQVLGALLLGLTPLVRPDLVLISVVPAMLLVKQTRGSWRVLVSGLLPGVSWTVFATVYYGSPVPNTALAKLGHAPIHQNLTQGLAYLESSQSLDPALLPVWFLGTLVALSRVRAQPAAAAFAVGSLLYVGYVVSIGGDFMSGRFLAIPLMISVAALVATDSPWAGLVGVIAAGLSMTATSGPLRTSGAFHVPNWDDAGIADERGWYFPHLGLEPILREGRDPPRPGRVRRAGEGRVRMGKAIGMDAYMAGPHVHLVDAYALCDPLLARIPSDETLGRPGHWIRPVPSGYLETLKTGQNQLKDPEVARLWTDVVLATRAPLLQPGRASAIWRLMWAGRTAPIEGVPPMQSPPRTPQGTQNASQ